MQSLIPQLARQIPEVPALVEGLKVKLVLQPQVELLMRVEPEGQTQDPLEPEMKVAAHSEHVLLAEQITQLATLHTKHWFNNVFRLNPVWQA